MEEFTIGGKTFQVSLHLKEKDSYNFEEITPEMLKIYSFNFRLMLSDAVKSAANKFDW